MISHYWINLKIPLFGFLSDESIAAHGAAFLVGEINQKVKENVHKFMIFIEINQLNERFLKVLNFFFYK